MKKTKIIALLALSVLVAGAAHAKAKDKLFRLGASNGENARFGGAIGVSIETGILEEELKKVGYKAEYFGFSNGVATNEAILSGDVDIVSIGDLPGLTGFSNGIGSIWLADEDKLSDVGILIRDDANINTIEDFYGKPIAVNFGTAPHFQFEQWVIDYGVDRSQLDIQNLTAVNGILALKTKDVVAVAAVWKRLLPVEEAGKYHEFWTTLERPDLSGQTMIVGRKKFIDKNEKAVVAFFKALYRAREEIIKDPIKWYDIISSGYLNNQPELGEKLYNRENNKFYNFDFKLSEDEITRAQKEYDFFLSIERFRTKKDVHNFVNNSYAQKAYKELKNAGFAITE